MNFHFGVPLTASQPAAPVSPIGGDAFLALRRAGDGA
jgi:hypothetical protein